MIEITVCFGVGKVTLVQNMQSCKFGASMQIILQLMTKKTRPDFSQVSEQMMSFYEHLLGESWKTLRRTTVTHSAPFVIVILRYVLLYNR